MPINRSKMHLNYKDNWGTPWKHFYLIQNALNGGVFTIDVAASKENSKCAFFLEEAFGNDWTNYLWLEDAPQFWWCNPPFSLKEAFLIEAHKQLEKGNEGLMLLPASWETKWFRNNVTYPNMPRLAYPSRIQFIDPDPPKDPKKKRKGNIGGSVIVAFIKDPSKLQSINNEPWVTNFD